MAAQPTALATLSLLAWLVAAAVTGVASAAAAAATAATDGACDHQWQAARRVLREYTLVMDPDHVAEDRHRLATLPAEFDRILERLRADACVAAGSNGGDASALGGGQTQRPPPSAAHALLPTAVREVHRAHGHITKDLLAGGRVRRVTRETVQQVAGAWLYRLLDRLLSEAALADGVPQAATPSKRDTPLGLVHDGDGLTPMHLAVFFREHRLLRHFLDGDTLPGAAQALDVGAAGWFGMTPLHLAIVLADRAAVALLAAAGADPAARDAYGRTAWEIAAVLNYDAILSHLTCQSCVGPGQSPIIARSGAAPIEHELSDLVGVAPSCAIPRPNALVGRLISLPAALSAAPADSAVAARKADSASAWCPVARRRAQALDDLSMGRDFVSLLRPLIIENAMDGWAVRRSWARSMLSRQFPDHRAQVGRIPYGNVFGEQHARMRLSDFASYLERSEPAAATVPLPPLPRKASTTVLATGSERASAQDLASPSLPSEPEGSPTLSPSLAEQLPLYIFDSSILNKEGAFFRLAENPLPSAFSSLLQRYPLVRQFYWGPAYSGSPQHFHCDAINALVRGQKRWLLLPPAQAHYSKEHPTTGATWAALAGGYGTPTTEGSTDYGMTAHAEVPYVCDQTEGELMYVPAFWGHATINAVESIGFAIEIDRGDC